MGKARLRKQTWVNVALFWVQNLYPTKPNIMVGTLTTWQICYDEFLVKKVKTLSDSALILD